MRAIYPYLLAVLLANPALAATVNSSSVTRSGNGHSYALLSESTWDDAEATAIALGGHLATIGVVEIAPAPGAVCFLDTLGLAGLSRRR